MKAVIKKTSFTQSLWTKIPNPVWAMLLSVPTTFCMMMLSLLLLPESFFPGDTSKSYFAFFLFVSFYFIWEISLNLLGYKDADRISDEKLQTKYKSDRSTYKRYCLVSLSIRSGFFLLWAGIILYFQLWSTDNHYFLALIIPTFITSVFVFGFTRAHFFPVFRLESHEMIHPVLPGQTTSPTPNWEKSAAHDEPTGAWVPMNCGAPVAKSEDTAYYGRLGS